MWRRQADTKHATVSSVGTEVAIAVNFNSFSDGRGGGGKESRGGGGEVGEDDGTGVAAQEAEEELREARYSKRATTAVRENFPRDTDVPFVSTPVHINYHK